QRACHDLEDAFPLCSSELCGLDSWGFASRNPLQLETQVMRTLEPVVRILGQAGCYDLLEHRWRERMSRGNWLRFFFKDGTGNADLAPARERPVASHHFVKNHAQCKEVRSRVGLFALQLFRGHILDGP